MEVNKEISDKQWFYGGKLCKVCLEYDNNMVVLSDYLEANCKSILNECDHLIWDKLPHWLCSKCEKIILQVIKMRDKFKYFLEVYMEFYINRSMYEEADLSFIRNKILSLKKSTENKMINLNSTKYNQVGLFKSEIESSDINMKMENEYDIDVDYLNIASPIIDNVSEIEPDEVQVDIKDESHDRMIKNDHKIEEEKLFSISQRKKNILKKVNGKRKKNQNKLKNKLKEIKNEIKAGFSSRMVVETDEYRVIRFTKEQVLAELEKKRISEHYECMPFKCQKCVKGFNYDDVLANHMKKHISKSDNLECDICSQFINGKISMRGHIKSHLTRYECKVCGVVRASRQHLLEHHATAHSYAHTIYICSHCGKSCTKRTMFQKHMRTHYPSSSKKCDKCGKLFKSIDTLRAHLLRHTDVMRYKCEQCPRKFCYASLLYTHKNIHTTTRDYYCVECDTSFKTASNLRLHLQKSLKHVDAGTFKHECEYCHKRFDRTTSLRRHINWVHLERRDYKCNECDATFGSPDGLRSHRRKKHEGVKRPRSHICEVCNKGFMQKSVLQKHLRIHTGERPFECKQCGRKFAQDSTLSTHYKLVHLKVKRGVGKKPLTDKLSPSKQEIIRDISPPKLLLTKH